MHKHHKNEKGIKQKPIEGARFKERLYTLPLALAYFDKTTNKDCIKLTARATRKQTKEICEDRRNKPKDSAYKTDST